MDAARQTLTCGIAVSATAPESGMGCICRLRRQLARHSDRLGSLTPMRTRQEGQNTEPPRDPKGGLSPNREEPLALLPDAPSRPREVRPIPIA